MLFITTPDRPIVSRMTSTPLDDPWAEQDLPPELPLGVIYQSLVSYRNLPSISQWGYQFDGDKLAGYCPIPSEILSVLALPLADSLLHLSLLNSTYQIPSAIAKWAENIVLVHLDGSARISSTRNNKLHRQALLRPRQSVTLAAHHITRYQIRLRATRPILTLMFAALRSDVVTKYLRRVPTLPPFLTIKLQQAVDQLSEVHSTSALSG